MVLAALVLAAPALADTDPAKGTWTQYVFDINQGDGGRLHCWTLDINTT